MKKTMILAFTGFLGIFLSRPLLQVQEVKFQWFGQACFLIETSQGTKIVTDPMKMWGYAGPVDISPDIVTVSHAHMDHNMVDAVQGTPTVLGGLNPEGRKFVQIREAIKDVKIFNVLSFHDASQGDERGLNSIFVLEFDGLRCVHLGDLGHVLDAEQIQAIGEVDVLMIPVGGRFTIAEGEAEKVIDQLNPKLVVFPMHFKTDAASFLPFSGEDFIQGKPNAKISGSNVYTLNLNDLLVHRQLIVLGYK